MCGGCRFLWYLHNPKTKKNIKNITKTKAKANFISCLFLLVFGGIPTCSLLYPFCCVQSFWVKIYLWVRFFIKIEGRLQNISRLSWVSSLCVRHACILDTTCTHEHAYNTYMHRRPFSPIAYVNIYKEISMKEIKQICA